MGCQVLDGEVCFLSWVGFAFGIYYTFTLIHLVSFGFTLVYDDKILRMCLFPFSSIFVFVFVFVFACWLAFPTDGFIPYVEFGVRDLVCPLKLYEYVQFKITYFHHAFILRWYFAVNRGLWTFVMQIYIST